MRKSKSPTESRKHPLDEWSDDEDFADPRKSKSSSKGEAGDSSTCSVRCTVFSAHCAWRNEKKKEKADPYCIVTYQGESHQTTQLYGTTMPKWNETFDFMVVNRNALGQMIIQLWDKNNQKDDDFKKQIFLGEIKISMPEYQDVDFNFCEARTYPLETRSKAQKTDKVKGDLSVKVGMVLESKKIRSPGFGFEPTKEEKTAMAEDLIDDSYDSILRSINMATNARDVHAETLNLLDGQGQQIRRIQEKMDDIDTMQNRADRHIRSINSLGGYVGNKFIPEISGKNRSKKADNKADKVRKSNEQKRKKAAKSKSFGFASDSDDSDSDKDIIIQTRTGELEARRAHDVGLSDLYKGDGGLMLSDQHIDKMKATDKALDVLGDVIHDLHDMSIQAGDALDEHNARLDVLDKSIMRANQRVRQHNTKIRR